MRLIIIINKQSSVGNAVFIQHQEEIKEQKNICQAYLKNYI